MGGGGRAKGLRLLAAQSRKKRKNGVRRWGNGIAAKGAYEPRKDRRDQRRIFAQNWKGTERDTINRTKSETTGVGSSNYFHSSEVEKGRKEEFRNGGGRRGRRLSPKRKRPGEGAINENQQHM